MSASGSDGQFDPFDVDRVRRQVVMPVVEALLRPGELHDVQVTWTPPAWLVEMEPYRRRHSEELFVVLTAGGETFFDYLWHPDWTGLDTAADVRRRLADHLEDWVCETRFAWGEQRLVPESVLEGLP